MHRFLPLVLSFVIASPAAGDVGRCAISADFIAEPEIIETLVPLAGVEVLSTTQRSVSGAPEAQLKFAFANLASSGSKSSRSFWSFS